MGKKAQRCSPKRNVWPNSSAANSLGTAYLKDGRSAEALPYFTAALDIALAEDDRPGQGVIRLNLGTTYLAVDQPDLAVAHLRAGLEIATRTDNLTCRRAILNQLAKAYTNE